jgi:hypothetical protein
MNTIEIKIVHGADGNVDVEATITEARAAVEHYKAQREIEETTILNALNTVFDRLKANGTRANMPYVIGQALQLLGVSEMPTIYKTLEPKVRQFLQLNSRGPNSLFVINKGKNGGVARRSDLPNQEVAKS